MKKEINPCKVETVKAKYIQAMTSKLEAFF